MPPSPETRAAYQRILEDDAPTVAPPAAAAGPRRGGARGADDPVLRPRRLDRDRGRGRRPPLARAAGPPHRARARPRRRARPQGRADHGRRRDAARRVPRRRDRRRAGARRGRARGDRPRDAGGRAHRRVRAARRRGRRRGRAHRRSDRGPRRPGRGAGVLDGARARRRRPVRVRGPRPARPARRAGHVAAVRGGRADGGRAAPRRAAARAGARRPAAAARDRAADRLRRAARAAHGHHTRVVGRARRSPPDRPAVGRAGDRQDPPRPRAGARRGARRRARALRRVRARRRRRLRRRSPRRSAISSTDAPEELLRAHVARHGNGLARLVPALASRLPDVGPAPPGDPETERFQLLAAIAGLLVDAALARPLVLVLDDLHWADGPTLAAIRHLVAGAAPRPVPARGDLPAHRAAGGGGLAGPARHAQPRDGPDADRARRPRARRRRGADGGVRRPRARR